MNILDFWLNILFPICSLMVAVFGTVYTVSHRVHNENREKHRPYLVLDKVEPLDKIDVYAYYLMPIGRNYRQLNEIINAEQIDKLDGNYDLNINLLF